MMWGNKNNGHSFCGVILPDGKTIPFQDIGDDGSVAFNQKIAKIYRSVPFGPKMIDKPGDSIPSLFQQRIFDVTKSYGIKTRDIIIRNLNDQKQVVYLSVFNMSGWFPIAKAEIKEGVACFKDIGIGDIDNLGENIHDGILYLPTYYSGEIEPAGNPIIVSCNGVQEIGKPKGCNKVQLFRKYPRFNRIISFADNMVGGIVEGGCKKDFSDAEELLRIESRPFSREQTYYIRSHKPIQYIRYRKPRGTFSIAEFHCYSDREELGQIIGPNYLENIESVFDGDPLSFVEVSKMRDVWVGLYFHKPIKVKKVCITPRTDDNDISIGDKYELFYWDNKWLSIGQKDAKEQSIVFDNVPNNALLWLRDLTRGREERPFLIISGEQYWL